MIQINPLKSYIDGGVRAALTTPPSASLVFDLPGKAIWVKGVKLKGTDHTYTFSHDNYITLTNTPDSNESEDIKIGVNTSALKNAIDTTYGVVSTTTNGLAPKFTSENKLAAVAATTYYFLGWTGTTLKWYQTPFRNIRINSETTDCLGVNNTDPLIISSGNGISVTWDSTNKKIIITNTKPDVNHNTDTKVALSVTTLDKNYAVILKGNDSDEGSITTVNFSTYLKFNPYTKQLTINGTAVSLNGHTHSDYITVLGTNGNYLTWTKNGNTNNIIVPYANNADKVDEFHAMSAGSLFYKYKVTATIPASSITGDFWYATITFSRSWVKELTKSLIDADYSNIRGLVYLNTYDYEGAWYAFTTSYNGCNIRGIALKNQYTPIYYIRLAKPTTYSNTIPDGKITVYSPYNCTITVSPTAPSGVTFTNITVPGFTNLKANSAYIANLATTATYTSNVGTAGTAGTNYVTASKVIATCNWYDTMIGTDSDTVINRWSEIVAFVANFKETPDLATYLSNNYLAKSGGTMIGPLKWANDTALPEQTSPKYFVCTDAFADGGTTKYASKINTLKALTGLTSTAIGDSDEPVYWNGTTFVKANAYPTKASWNYDDVYSKLEHTHNNYVTINTNQTITNCKIFKMNAPVDDRETVYYNIGLKLSSFGDNHKKVAAIGMGNEHIDWYKAAIGFERTNTYDRGDIVFLLNNKSDRTTCVYSDIKVRINANGNINTLGTVSASGFIKTNSSDSYVLLGGGGHKAVSDFALASDLNNYVTLTTAQTITGVKTFAKDTFILAGTEHNDIRHATQIAPNWGGYGNTNTTPNYTGMYNSLDFYWYNDIWSIGNLRSGNTITHGFGIGLKKKDSNNNLYFAPALRITETASYINNNIIWHAGNDGSGSRLDADLLDGTHKVDLFTNLSNTADNELLVTIGGTNKTLVVGYATISNYLTSRYIGSNGDTVAQVKLKILDSYTSLIGAQGYSILVNSSFIGHYSEDNYVIPANGIYSLTYLTPGYDGKSYGQWLAACLGSERLYVIGRNSNLWTERKTIAWTSDIPTVTNYYWANIKVSSTSSTSTSPTFATATTITSIITPLVTNSNTLTLNGTSGVYIKYNNNDSTAIVLSNTYFKPFDTANNKLTLGSNSARWSNVYSVLGNYSGNITALGFIKSGSSDSYVLLGGGSHKAISDFMLKTDELSNNLTTISKSLTVTKDWMDTDIKNTDLPANGTYIIQVSANNTADSIRYNYWSGIMSWYKDGTDDNEADEIILHRAGHAYGHTIYLRTIMTTSSDGRHLRLQIAADTNLSTAVTYTFKFKRVI